MIRRNQKTFLRSRCDYSRIDKTYIVWSVSVDTAALRVCFFGFLVKIYRCSVQIVALRHQVIHCLSALNQVLKVLVNNVLDFLELSFNAEQFVGFEWILPLAKINLHLGELYKRVSIDFSLEQATWLELVSELHDKLVEESVGCAFIVLIVCHCGGCNSILCYPTMALAYIILKSDRCFVSKRDSSSDGSGVKVDEFLGNTALVEPKILQIHLHTEQLGVLGLPFVHMQCNKSHYLTDIEINNY